MKPSLLFACLTCAALLAASVPAQATTTTCYADLSSPYCKATFSGTFSPNHARVYLAEDYLRVTMYDPTSPTYWRSCTAFDDGSSTFAAMHRTAVAAQTLNLSNKGKLYMYFSGSTCVGLYASDL